jgi:flagellar hook-length control protein FliK
MQPNAARSAPRPDKSDAPLAEAKGDVVESTDGPQAIAQKPQPKTAPAVAPRDSAGFMTVDVQQTPVQSAAQATGGMLAPGAAPSAQTHAVLDQSAARVAPAAAQVAREIVRRFDGESTRFEVRMDPPELGRVEVRLEVSRDHRVTAMVAADTPQALSELVRHARELEQSLQSAGLELGEDGLSFDLRQSREDAQDAGAEGGRRNAHGGDGDDGAPPPAARPIGLERWRGVRVDVWV